MKLNIVIIILSQAIFSCSTKSTMKIASASNLHVETDHIVFNDTSFVLMPPSPRMYNDIPEYLDILQQLGLNERLFYLYKGDYNVVIQNGKDSISETTRLMIDSLELIITNNIYQGYISQSEFNYENNVLKIEDGFNQNQIDVLVANSSLDVVFGNDISYFLVSREKKQMIMITTLTSLCGSNALCRMVGVIDLNKNVMKRMLICLNR